MFIQKNHVIYVLNNLKKIQELISLGFMKLMLKNILFFMIQKCIRLMKNGISAIENVQN